MEAVHVAASIQEQSLVREDGVCIRCNRPATRFIRKTGPTAGHCEGCAKVILAAIKEGRPMPKVRKHQYKGRPKEMPPQRRRWRVDVRRWICEETTVVFVEAEEAEEAKQLAWAEAVVGNALWTQKPSPDYVDCHRAVDIS
jgi:hypothetical protein